MLRLVLCCLLLLAFSVEVFAWTGVVVNVHDGDTLTVQRNDTGEKVRVRLHGIDCPESYSRTWKAQPYSKKARNFVRDNVLHGAVVVMDMGYDTYARTLAGVIPLPDGHVVEEILKAGLAWVYDEYCLDCRQWKELEEEARTARRGLRRNNNPVPPWEWRRRLRQTSVHDEARQPPNVNP